MEPAPPQITIVDPNAPLDTTELLGTAREPWRASPYQKAVVTLAALVVALVSIGVARIRHVHHEAALDRAAAADVHLEVQANGAYYSDNTVTLINLTGRRVVVESIALVGAGFRTRHERIGMDSDSVVDVELASLKNCGDKAIATGPTQVAVTVRTVRGLRVTRTLQLPLDVAKRLHESQRASCGFLPPEDSLSAELLTAKRVGDVVVATFQLENNGRGPITVSDLQGWQGVTATGRLPITLGGAQFWTGHSKPARLTVRLHVSDCVLFSNANQDPSLTQVGELTVSVSTSDRSGQTSLVLVGFPDGQGAELNAVVMLERTCPRGFFSVDGTY